jgi:hypothetical protein
MNPARSENDGVLFSAATAEVRIRWNLKLPEGATLLPGPSDEARWRSASFSARTSENQGMVLVEYEITWDGNPVPPGEYAACRTFLARALEEKLGRVVFRAKES